MKSTKARGAPPTEEYFFKRMKLQTHADIYQAMAKLTRLATMGKISTDRYRSTIYGLHLMINALDRKSASEVENKSPKTLGVWNPDAPHSEGDETPAERLNRLAPGSTGEDDGEP